MTTDQIQRIVEEAKQLTLDELKTISEQLLEEIEEREWDRLLSSPEGIAEGERELAKTKRAIVEGDIIEYIPGKSLEELFAEK